jgi:sodium-dependent dicarboxylate transporter 2/3/5
MPRLIHAGERRTPTLPAPGRRTIIIAVSAVAAAGTYFGLRPLTGELPARAASIFVVASIFWATEVLPLFATAFVAIALQVVCLATDGGLAGDLSRLLELLGLEPVPIDREISAGAFFAVFGADIIILFMGGFLLSAALVKHGIDRVVARRVLGPFMRTPATLIVGVLLVTAALSMWMSNTATAAMMIAILRPIIDRIPKDEPFRVALALAVPFGANIGGIGTPIGTPPNAIVIGALQQAGFEVTFLEWMLIAVPLELVMLAFVAVFLYRTHPPRGELRFPRIEAGGKRLGKMGVAVLAIMLVAIALWLTSGWHGLRPGAVALLAAAALTALGLLDRTDVDSIDWNVLILMWGGLSLGVAMRESGLADLIGALDLQNLPGGEWLFAAGIAVVGATLSTFMSNTATAGLLIPMALALAVPGRENYAVIAALACSFAMAMPVSTPPNAISYATGWIPRRALIRGGAIVCVTAILVMLAGHRLMLPLLF